MATLIPAIGACSSRMTNGERRFAQRLEAKLESDYLCWYDVFIGERTRHPDFVVLHPSRGLLILEVKDWKTATIQSIDKQTATILTDHGIKHELNPLEQARQFMFAVIKNLEHDPQLVQPNGKPILPYGHGVVFTNISRQQFDATNLSEVIPAHLVICQDEMTESVDAEEFQKRMWDMFPYKFGSKLTLPQIDRIRWHMFPEIRIPARQKGLFDEQAQQAMEIPDLLRVMDIQQEQLARSLGEGHRIVHGVAGSGKTLILGYRAEHLSKICQRPILVLCYNKPLATKLADMIQAKGIQDKVQVVNFHAWCIRQLNAFHVQKPERDGKNIGEFFAACVDKVIESVERGAIPASQYDAVLIDEGHDFKPEWFKLVVQMIHPDTNSLLVLYDDAQSIYNGAAKLRFSFSSVGIQAKGRTTVLKLNYRNTAEILAVARAFADDLLTNSDAEDDQAPTLQPISSGRHGPKPLLIKLPTLAKEAEYLADQFATANKMGRPWNEMAVLYRSYEIGREVATIFERKKIPFEWRDDRKNSYTPSNNSVKIITMHSSKGLEFPMVCIPGLGAPNRHAIDPGEEARLLYVAMTRATDELVMTYGEESAFAEKMRTAMMTLENI